MAKEFNNGQEEGLYASTPPLEALRWLLSHAATFDHKAKKQEEKVILIADVSRAFFEAPMHRNVAVELPAEALAKEEMNRDLIGALDMSFYGNQGRHCQF